ncbi:hypothetical protein [Segatella copri]|uniref:hypothetical protein n=1 Tax=Segatella copri TaxID=165179 RepID=UPI002230EF47|nr:hypothetical protein [Segatella copri]MCW4076534.1 hypothetical protein [Segatella copri]MCW4109365.1 hypothetical protein [Segatella copri]
MSRTLHLFGTDWGAMMVPIQVIRWYRMQCYDGTDSCAIVVPIRRYCHLIESDCEGDDDDGNDYSPQADEARRNFAYHAPHLLTSQLDII